MSISTSRGGGDDHGDPCPALVAVVLSQFLPMV